MPRAVVICLKIRTFVVSATTTIRRLSCASQLWFAWKFVPLWYQQQPYLFCVVLRRSCDLLENSYLCGISNNTRSYRGCTLAVVICLKIRTFVVSATTLPRDETFISVLWFAWKFVPLWYQQQQFRHTRVTEYSCDLLENSYLCGISNNPYCHNSRHVSVVICLKIRTFVVSATTCLKVLDVP